MPLRAPLFDREAAEALALQAVAAIAADDDLLSRFLALTGSGADDLRHRLGDADFLGAVLDFMLQDDTLVQRLATAAGVTPETVALARAKLPGASTEA